MRKRLNQSRKSTQKSASAGDGLKVNLGKVPNLPVSEPTHEG